MSKQTLFVLAIAASLSFVISINAHSQSESSANVVQAVDPSLPGKRINNPYNIQWKTEGSDKSESIQEAPSIPGGMAYRVKVKKKKRKAWDTATRIPMTASIEKGDVIMVAFWARSAKPPKGKDFGEITVALQRNIEPYDSVLSEPVELAQEWKLYKAVGKANRDFDADKTNLNFNLAHAKQDVEFGRFYISSLGPDADPSDYVGN